MACIMEIVRMCGEPLAQVQGGLESRATLAEWFSENADLFGLVTLNCAKGNLIATLTGEAGFVFRNTPLAG